MTEKLSLDEFMRVYDPGTEIDLARLARVETRLMERLVSTPQGTFQRPPQALFPDFVVPLWRGALLSLLLLCLGAYSGMQVGSFVRPETQTVAETEALQHSVTVFAMVAPWQALVVQ